MEPSNVSAVLFAKDLASVTDFYAQALGMDRSSGDEDHSVLNCRGFKLTVHRIPQHIADEISLERPPRRRAEGALRLSFPVQNIEGARRIAKSLGGQVDDTPPAWAGSNANFFLGHDPEGNVFKVSEHAR